MAIAVIIWAAFSPNECIQEVELEYINTIKITENGRPLDIEHAASRSQRRYDKK
ncbi:MAG: hypothetical protein ACOYVK_02915 [Bacillota bacterium]